MGQLSRFWLGWGGGSSPSPTPGCDKFEHQSDVESKGVAHSALMQPTTMYRYQKLRVMKTKGKTELQCIISLNSAVLLPFSPPIRAVLNAKKKVVPEHCFFKRARGHYMSSPWCSQLFNHESLAQNLCNHTTI